MVGLAVAYLLASAITGHAEQLRAILSARILRPVAVLSYSMYLLQYVAITFLFDFPLVRRYFPMPSFSNSYSSIAVGTLVVHAHAVILCAYASSFATFNYFAVEKPMIKAGAALLFAPCCLLTASVIDVLNTELQTSLLASQRAK